MNRETLKTGIKLAVMIFVIWYGLGSPIPTNGAEAVKLVIGIAGAVYTGWKNFNFSQASQIAQNLLNDIKNGDWTTEYKGEENESSK